MASIKELVADVEAKLTHARAIDMTANRSEIAEASDAVEAAKKALADALVVGAKPCPTCAELPHGMLHEVSVRKQTMAVIEIGCTGCRDHRAQGFTPAHAVARWNAGEFIPPSAGPGIRGAEEQMTIEPGDVGELNV